MKRTFLVAAGLLLVLFTAVAIWPDSETSVQQEALAGELDVVLHVQGMSCQLCARSMTNQLKKIDAVEEVQVLLDEQRVLVTLKTQEAVTEKALREAVTNAGFETRKVDFAGSGLRPISSSL